MTLSRTFALAGRTFLILDRARSHGPGSGRRRNRRSLPARGSTSFAPHRPFIFYGQFDARSTRLTSVAPPGRTTRRRSQGQLPDDRVSKPREALATGFGSHPMRLRPRGHSWPRRRNPRGLTQPQPNTSPGVPASTVFASGASERPLFPQAQGQAAPALGRAWCFVLAGSRFRG